jgi:hypothetical protein
MKALCLALALALSPVQASAFDVSDPKAIAPIIEMTKSSWVALRKWEGAELLYFTHLESWRCAVASVRFSLNDGAWQDWSLAPCQTGTPTPNALPEGYLPYTRLDAELLQSIAVQVEMADGQVIEQRFARGDILMP